MENTSDTHLSYSQSITELENIVRMMQSDKCDIDSLAAYTRRATELLDMCRRRLTATEEQLRETLAALQQQ
ncbi:MAG: exodeoxyribonuclease VII small subunit [Muribaculaceae bacterium]|nr:exodeoxyribonuclease VII small subunit [Muribaculaceae bacterium]